MKERLSPDEALEYWKAVHDSTPDDLQAVCFPDKSRQFNRFIDGIEQFALSRAIRTTIGSVRGAAVLDVGSGRGRWLSFYRSLGAAPTGLDVSETAVAVARRRGFDVRLASATLMPFKTATFDLVNEVVVLLHLPAEEQVKAVAELERVCRPGGYLVMLDITAGDPSPHVFPRSTDSWVNLFRGSTLVYAESHYFVWPIRALWKSPLMKWRRPVPQILERVAVAVSVPVEYAAMTLLRGRSVRLGLQHVLIFRRNGDAGPNQA